MKMRKKISISPAYRAQILRNVKILRQQKTVSERVYEREVCKFLRSEYHVHYTAQYYFFIADQVAFIADFYFHRFRLAVEIDGSAHRRRAEQDAWRTQLLKEIYNVNVLRFTNKQVEENPALVLDQTVEALLVNPVWDGFTKYLRRYRRHY